MTSDFHFYEPSLGHRLAHDPFNAIVGPRPIGWIGTRSADGRHNLAPYSFFNAFNYTPPLIGFASVGAKDTLSNVQGTGEFSWNLVSRNLAEAMSCTSASVPPGVDEFQLAGLEPAESRVIRAPRVAEALVSFECKLTQCVQLVTLEARSVQTWLVLGQVVGVHIAQTLLKNGAYDTAAARPVLRGGGAGDYFEIGSEQLFRMKRPT